VAWLGNTSQKEFVLWTCGILIYLCFYEIYVKIFDFSSSLIYYQYSYTCDEPHQILFYFQLKL